MLFRQRRIGTAGSSTCSSSARWSTARTTSSRTSIDLNEGADGLFKIADDPRVTRVGRLLRRTSLDELPQLVNVLRGQMSLVGPRPLVPEEDRRIEGWQRTRLRLKPGHDRSLADLRRVRGSRSGRW